MTTPNGRRGFIDDRRSERDRTCPAGQSRICPSKQLLVNDVGVRASHVTMSPDHDDDVNFRRLMDDMLSRAFDAGGLRRFVTQRCSAAISRELPGEGTSLAAMVHTFIDVGLRHDIFDEEFFARLVEERPRLQGDIAAVRAYYQRWRVDTGRAMQRGFKLRLRIGRFFIMIVLAFVSVAMGRVIIALMAGPPGPPAGEPEVYVPPPPPWIREPPPKASPSAARKKSARSWPLASEMPEVDCSVIREETFVAERTGDWNQLYLRAGSSCWQGDPRGLQWRVRAKQELGEFADCVSLGKNSSDPRVLKMVKFCHTRQLMTLTETTQDETEASP